jgi:hypothetical protein
MTNSVVFSTGSFQNNSILIAEGTHNSMELLAKMLSFCKDGSALYKDLTQCNRQTDEISVNGLQFVTDCESRISGIQNLVVLFSRSSLTGLCVQYTVHLVLYYSVTFVNRFALLVFVVVTRT